MLGPFFTELVDFYELTLDEVLCPEVLTSPFLDETLLSIFLKNPFLSPPLESSLEARGFVMLSNLPYYIGLVDFLYGVFTDGSPMLLWEEVRPEPVVRY